MQYNINKYNININNMYFILDKIEYKSNIIQ